MRSGFSTGACAAAVVTAAFQSFCISREGTKKDFLNADGDLIPEVVLNFPDGSNHTMSLSTVHTAYAEIVKDAGDDPDCTNGATLYASIEEATDRSIDEKDYEFKINATHFVLQAVEGIGFCTRNGLPCAKGKWAINPVPLQMIFDNLKRVGVGNRDLRILIKLGVKNGAELAKKTLNNRLGIVGGISILGTTGFVRPYSHVAYEETIRMLVEGAARNNYKRILFATGSRTSKGAMEYLNPFPEEALIMIGDYIGAALGFAKSSGISEVILSCMPGKLCKYIAGHENTHAHRTTQDLTALEKVIKTLDPRRGVNLRYTPTIREALHVFNPEEQYNIMQELVPMAIDKLQTIAVGVKIRILLFGFSGEFLMDSSKERK